MLSADKIHEKRLKRKNIKRNRMSCHGSVFNCQEEHPMKKSVFISTPKVVEKKESFISKLKKKLWK